MLAGPISRASRSVVSISALAAGSRSVRPTSGGSTACSAGRNSADPAPSATIAVTSAHAGGCPFASHVAARTVRAAARKMSAAIMTRRGAWRSARPAVSATARVTAGSNIVR